ncbi:acetylxylan esterase, partial [Streptosporangium sp. NPDC001682]
MPLDRLRQYRPERREPGGFDAFWARTLAETRESAGRRALWLAVT